MKIATKLLLILSVVGLSITIILTLGAGIYNTLMTYQPNLSYEDHNVYYLSALSSFIICGVSLLPLIFSSVGLAKINNYQNGDQLIIVGILLMIFGNTIPGILMIIFGSDEKVSENEAEILQSISQFVKNDDSLDEDDLGEDTENQSVEILTE